MAQQFLFFPYRRSLSPATNSCTDICGILKAALFQQSAPDENSVYSDIFITYAIIRVRMGARGTACRQALQRFTVTEAAAKFAATQMPIAILVASSD
jgi:hypothetical protein